MAQEIQIEKMVEIGKFGLEFVFGLAVLKKRHSGSKRTFRTVRVDPDCEIRPLVTDETGKGPKAVAETVSLETEASSSKETSA